MALLGWLGLVGLAASCILLDSATAFPGTAALCPVLSSAAVIAAGCVPHRAGPAVLLGLAPLRAIGRLSYSWYLWHWPVLLFAPMVVGHSLDMLGRLSAALVSLGLAVLTTAILESPVRQARSLVRYPRRGLLLAGSLTCVTALTALLAVQSLPSLAGQGLASTPVLAAGVPTAPAGPGGAGRTADQSQSAQPPQTPLDRLVGQVQSALAAALRANRVPANLTPSLSNVLDDMAEPFRDGCLASGTATQLSACFYADTATTNTVLLMGDSHAAQWFPAFERYARDRRLRLQLLAKGTCPPLRITVFSPALGRNYTECTRFLDQAIAEVRSIRPRLVVLGVARHYGPAYHFTVYSPQWLAGLAESVRQIRAAGAPVLVLGPIPKPPRDVPNCLSEHLADAQRCTTTQATTLNANGIRAEQAAVLAAGGQYLDLSTLFCTAGRCPVIVGNILLFRDDNHLTTSYPGWLSPVLGAELDAARAAAGTAGYGS